jgi:glycosyltransferase involved in cell wall biosynthesis
MAKSMRRNHDASEMDRLGRKAVSEKYNWEVESKKLIKLYAEVLQ